MVKRLSLTELRCLRMLDELNPAFVWKIDLFTIIDAVAKWERVNGRVCGVVDFEVTI